MTWDGVFRLRGESLAALASRLGGHVMGDGTWVADSLAATELASRGQLTPVLAPRFVAAARAALGRGAALLLDAGLAVRFRDAARVWVHANASWAFADLLESAEVSDDPPILGPGSSIAKAAYLGPRTVVGARVSVGPGAVIGYPGFGWALGSAGAMRAIPQRAGVVIGDDVSIGPLTTIDAGTLMPTRIGSGTKLDAHVHVGHNAVIGEGTIVAAQCGFAGSVRVGRNVLVGGQSGVADHVVIGDHARVAAKSGVISDVPPGAVVAGYPAMPRVRWWRSIARGSAPRRTLA